MGVEIPQPAAPAPAPGETAPVKREPAAIARESMWTLPKAIPRRLRVPLALALPVTLVSAWCILTLGNTPIVSELFLPSPIAVIRATLQMLFEHTLIDAIWASSLRITLA